MDKFSVRHPLNQWFAGLQEYKSAAKVVSNYTKESVRLTDHAGKQWDKIFYCLNPRLQTQGGLAPKSHFWCGCRFRTLSGMKMMKELSLLKMFAAPDGFYLGRPTWSKQKQETAYLSGDTALIEAVDCGKDFRSSAQARSLGCHMRRSIRTWSS